ncbi:hypothetical protein C3F09_10605 [candidate division GN15 bacterium]|uniref:PAS domain S-box protein n=1 Tax=candidate division GN15 bacterium TaxID=2072418 RepID=A0A855X424_9BACT|nr:MAG: hypothetical protein C3F09_10605 [candidate division GN15 bacterium]
MIAEKVEGRYRTLFDTGEPQQDEIVYQVGDTSVCVQSHRYPIFTDGRVSHAVVITRDISDFRAAQEALKHSEETATAILNASNESILLADKNGAIIALNDVAAARLGKPRSEIIGKTGKELLPPEIWQQRGPLIRNVIATGSSARFQDRRGDIVFDYTMNPVLDEAGSVAGVAIFATDVSASVAAQEELTRIRYAVESSSDAIAMSDMAGKHVFSNRAFEELLGYTVEQLNEAGGPPAAYRDPQAAEEVFSAIMNGKPWSGVVDMVTRYGQHLKISLRADAIRDADGKLIGLIGIHTDVTVQRQADEQLKRSEERFRLQFTSIPVPTFIWEAIDGDFVLREYNQAAHRMTRGGIVGFVGQRASSMYKNRPDIVQDLRECFGSQSIVFREMPYQYFSVKDERFLNVHYVPIPPNLILVHTIDLTDRKRAELALQEAHNELERKVAERTQTLERQVDFDALVRRFLTGFASSQAQDVDVQITSGLKELAEFFETDQASIILLSPDRNGYELTHTWAAPGIYDFTAEYRYSPMGSLPWLEQCTLAGAPVVLHTLDDFPTEAGQDRERYESEGVKSMLLMPLRGRGGTVNGAIALRSYLRTTRWSEDHQRWLRTVGDAIANVLERKQAEEARRAEQEKAELYLQTAEVMLMALDLEGVITRINRKGCTILEYEENELLGLNWFDTCIRPEDRDAVRSAGKGLLAGDSTKYETFENRVVTKSGAIRLIAWRNSLLRDKSGDIIGFLSSGEDVTDQRQAEAELDKAYERLQVEQEALHQKNVALQEMVEQVQESRRATAAQIQGNLERIVLPIIERIAPRLDPQGQEYLALVRTNLSEIVSPFVSELEAQFKRLSPREIEICELIRRGYDSKKIAEFRNTSLETVLKQRKAIRRKLGLGRKKVNLATYLTTTFPSERKTERKAKNY